VTQSLLSLRFTAILMSFIGGAAESQAQVADQTVDDIIVTATRRDEPLSRVPSSISAFSNDDMDREGIRSIADVARFAPGIRFDPKTAGISIRGVASGGAGAGTTGIYIDDTPIQMRGLGFNPDETLPAIFDLTRVEVLRGPQGTLFGAGSEGGTVRYITPQPPLTTPSAYARAEVSATAHGGANWEAGAALGIPIVTDRLGIRVSAWHRRDGGYIDHVAANGQVDDHGINHGDVSTARIALAWQPIPQLTLMPSLLYQQRSASAWNTFFAGISDLQASMFRTSSPERRGSHDSFFLPALNARFDGRGVSVIANLSYYDRQNVTGYDGTIYDLSYYQHPDVYPGPYDNNPLYPFLLGTGVNPNLPTYYSPSQVLNRQRILTGEVRAQSAPGAMLEWVGGVFFQRSLSSSTESLREDASSSFFQQVFGGSAEEVLGYPNFGPYNYYKQTRGVETQLAAFGNLRYELAPGLKLALGARLSRNSFSFDAFEAGSFTLLPNLSRGSTTQSPITPRVAVDYQISARTLLYASWAKGYRPGGANAAINPAVCHTDLNQLGLGRTPDTYGADTVRTIELGAKSAFAGGKVHLAASAYQNDWSDIQQNVYLATCGLQFVANLGQAEIRGFDVQISAAPTRGVALQAAIGYTHARLTRTVSLGSGVTSVQGGDAIEGAPWTVALGARYDGMIGRRRVYASIDGQYASRLQQPTPERNPLNLSSYLPGAVAPDSTTNLSLRIGTVVAGADLSLFVDNLLDAARRTSNAPVDAGALLVTETINRPRVVGVTMIARR
jgi:outer membrane receptor protein involved in Fe transport